MMAIAGNLMIACSLVLRKCVPSACRRSPSRSGRRRTRRSSGSRCSASSSARWATSPPSASQPTSSRRSAVCVIANSIISAIVLKGQFTVRNSVGLLLTVCGAFVVVVNAPPTIEHLTIERFLGLLMARCAAAAAAAQFGAIRGPQFAELRRALRLAVARPLFPRRLGPRALRARAPRVRRDVHAREPDALLAARIDHGALLGGDLQLYRQLLQRRRRAARRCLLIIPILFSTGVLQLRHLDKALEYHDNTRVMPTDHVHATMLDLGRRRRLQDFWGFTWRTAGNCVCSCALCFYGVYLITEGDGRRQVRLSHRREGADRPRRRRAARSASGGRRERGNRARNSSAGSRAIATRAAAPTAAACCSRGPSAERPAAPQPQVVRAQRAARHRRAHSASAPPLASAPALAPPVLSRRRNLAECFARGDVADAGSPPPHGTAPPTCSCSRPPSTTAATTSRSSARAAPDARARWRPTAPTAAPRARWRGQTRWGCRSRRATAAPTRIPESGTGARGGARRAAQLVALVHDAARPRDPARQRRGPAARPRLVRPRRVVGGALAQGLGHYPRPRALRAVARV